MKRVIIESPYTGQTARNIEYARRCVADSIHRGEAPIASHLLLTQEGILNDDDPEERALGILAGHAWYRVADLCAVYVDYGISKGMIEGMRAALAAGIEIDTRLLKWESPANWQQVGAVADRILKAAKR